MYTSWIEYVRNMERPWIVVKWSKRTYMTRNLKEKHGLRIDHARDIRRLEYMQKYIRLGRN